MSKFNKGDLIYIPSGTTIFKWSSDSNVPVGPTKILDKPRRGLFLCEISNFYSRVIFDGEAWTLKETDIYDLKGALPMIKGEQDLRSSRLMIKGAEDGGQTN